MGLNKFKKSPCGFCFVEYRCHSDAYNAVSLLNNSTFDERIIRVDLDAGVEEGEGTTLVSSVVLIFLTRFKCSSHLLYSFRV